ncbi:sigma-54-dependent Fis family transcriptional regulator [Lichenifustis flavocetrariae]|uniref:Sigma-54-dependent Fis family transcriptional regulator n=1 Tax=Lichenifustis flavocetrariae TaxID=2949735 RepID=A0AA41Z2H2_9HYPH|nr:sigma-54-dependent Fis family transcriptional regulator [Lichenifustis flavocetrariae]MCW6509308.1 sigma-54-dependent Fis family transcriptional regulator [Lichenifustis flavocetrariae]
MRPNGSTHVDELIRAAHGEVWGRDPVIGQSWRRCMDEYRLDPGAPRRAYIHTHQRLREHREAMDDLIRVARFGVESLYKQVSGLGYVLILSDAAGVAVDFIGDPSQDDALRRSGLYRGSDWNERLAGTCAVGTCIATGEPLTVHLDDHFAGDHIALTCTAAPIFASDGTLAAVLDISALQSPTPKTSQHLALQLVQSFAHRIETASLHNRFRGDWIVHLSRSREFAEIEPELALAVDASGLITGFNSRARRALEQSSTGRGDPAALLGARFEDIFDARLDDLPSLTRATPSDRRTLRLRGGGTFSALALRPAEPRSRREGKSAGTPTSPAEPDLNPALAMIATKAGRLLKAGIGVLLQGETGTGKEYMAKLLHARSARAAKPFVAVNCAALPETLIEAELFGTEPGAFTGAAPRGRPGLVQRADGGTLFLDEIGDMPLAVQTRLLRLLSEREVTAIGGGQPRAVDLQVLAATNRDLPALVREGRFREDLWYRLAGGVFTLPPLRDRDDLIPLIDRLLRQQKRALRLSAPARERLQTHSWPGNVRELAQALAYAAAMADGEEIGFEDLPAHLSAAATPVVPRQDEAAPRGTEADHLACVLQRSGWNVSEAARVLHVDRTTIHRRMHRFGIVGPHKTGSNP